MNALFMRGVAWRDARSYFTIDIFGMKLCNGPEEREHGLEELLNRDSGLFLLTL